jgi:hypothetical protein
MYIKKKRGLVWNSVMYETGLDMSFHVRKAVHKKYGDSVYIETFNTKISLCYSRTRIPDSVQKLHFRLHDWGMRA